MSEEVRQPVEDENLTSEQTNDLSELEKKIELLNNSKERILNESKDWKSKAQSYREELESIKKAQLEKDGDLEAMLAREREEKQGVSEKLKGMRKKIVETTTQNLLSKYASDATYLDTVYNEPLFREMVSYDDESLEVDESSIKEAVDKLREIKPGLFSKPRVKQQVNDSPQDRVPKEKPASLRDSLGALLG